MGKIKELFIELMQIYNGTIPGNLSIEEAQIIIEQEKEENYVKNRNKTGLQHGKPENS